MTSHFIWLCLIRVCCVMEPHCGVTSVNIWECLYVDESLLVGTGAWKCVGGVLCKILVGRLSTSLKNVPNRIWQGSKKGGQLDWKLGKRGSIGLNTNTMRGQSEWAWLFEGFEYAEKGTQSDWKSQKRGSSLQNLPNMPKYGSTPGEMTYHLFMTGLSHGWNTLSFIAAILFLHCPPTLLEYEGSNGPFTIPTTNAGLPTFKKE